jgi:hypothetical protein
MKTIMTYAICCSVLGSLLMMGTSPSPSSAPSQMGGNRDSASLWEQAIKAKGGRQRLYAVRNILESYDDKTNVGLFVFPSRLWRWTDDRPTWLGVYVEMINLDHDLSYFVEKDSGSPTNKGKYSALGRGRQPLIDAQLYYVLETEWIKPLPVRVYAGRIGNHPVDVVQTEVDGRRVDFRLDRQSHLPLEVAFPSHDTEGMNYGRGTYYATFSDYADVNGIQMPRKVGHMAKPEIPLSVRFNVDYDPDIFERPPRLKDGSDAWRPKSTTLPTSK